MLAEYLENGPLPSVELYRASNLCKKTNYFFFMVVERMIGVDKSKSDYFGMADERS